MAGGSSVLCERDDPPKGSTRFPRVCGPVPGLRALYSQGSNLIWCGVMRPKNDGCADCFMYRIRDNGDGRGKSPEQA